ncbi:hypothetical protein CH063_01238 [Colletotrichum higginsianum]|uniref:Uncharacterized protein n=1 Tax=Colletotrichum higginsianum (strain IMI 349063) TaxID=759273 RepID=H1V4A1_COLHI|nr:hypothetical protein CH063_01238 [Colletotrichum higginsianum]
MILSFVSRRELRSPGILLVLPEASETWREVDLFSVSGSRKKRDSKLPQYSLVEVEAPSYSEIHPAAKLTERCPFQVNSSVSLPVHSP